MQTVDKLLDQYQNALQSVVREHIEKTKSAKNLAAVVKPYFLKMYRDSLQAGRKEGGEEVKAIKFSHYGATLLQFASPADKARQRKTVEVARGYDGPPFFEPYLASRSEEQSRRFESWYAQLIKEKTVAYGKGQITANQLVNELSGRNDAGRSQLIEQLKQKQEQPIPQDNGLDASTRRLYLQQIRALNTPRAERTPSQENLIQDLASEYGVRTIREVKEELLDDIRLFNPNLQSLNDFIDTPKTGGKRRAHISLSNAEKLQVRQLIGNPKVLSNYNLDDLSKNDLTNLQIQIRNASYGIKPGETGAKEDPTQTVKRIIDYELASAYSLGRLQSFVQEGADYVQWSSMNDNRTSLYCTSLNTRIFAIEQIMQASHTMGKFVDSRKPYSVEGALNFHIPPAHPYCRSWLRPIKTTDKNKSKVQSELQALGVAIRNKDKPTLKKITDLYNWLNKSADVYSTISDSLHNYLNRRAKVGTLKDFLSNNKQIISLLLGGSLVMGGGVAAYFLFRDEIDEASTRVTDAVAEFMAEKGLDNPRVKAQELVQGLLNQKGIQAPTPIEEQILAQQVPEMIESMRKRGEELAQLVQDNAKQNPDFLRQVLNKQNLESLRLDYSLKVNDLRNRLNQLSISTWGVPFEAIREIRREAIGYRVLKNSSETAKLFAVRGMRSILKPLDTNYDDVLGNINQQIRKLEEQIVDVERYDPEFARELKAVLRKLKAQTQLTTDQLPDVRETDFVPRKVQIEIEARKEAVFTNYQNALSQVRAEQENILDAIIGQFKIDNLTVDYINQLPPNRKGEIIQLLQLKQSELRRLLEVNNLETPFPKLKPLNKKLRSLGAKVKKDGRFDIDHKEELLSQQALLRASFSELLDSITQKLDALQ